MPKLTRMRTVGAVVVAMAVGAGGPSAALAAGPVAQPAMTVAKKKPKKHCIKFKTVKSKTGKSIKRCAKYGK